MTGILKSCRVVDLANERGVLCGQMLADLGADVICVEPPGGSSARRVGPFKDESGDPNDSLFWWAYSRDKRSITLDLHSEAGRADLLELAASADFLIESDRPGEMAALGLAYEDLRAINPSLIYVSISAFGQTGPKARYADSDLIVLASAGPLLLAGDKDGPPVRCSVPQAYLHAGADAAVAALAAHHERHRSGLGQHIDVSAQVSAGLAAQFETLAVAVNSPAARRCAGGMMLGNIRVPFVWPAKDGYVSFLFQWGSALGQFSRKFMEYLYEIGGCDAATRDKDWIAYTMLLRSGEEPIEEWTRVIGVIESFTKQHTKAELLALALERGFLFAPVSTIEDLVASRQFAERDYFVQVEHPEHGRSFTYPGAFARISAAPIQTVRRAPRIGEHNDEIRSEPARSRPALRPGPTPTDKPLAGVKILDFMWVMAGPASTRMLADLGAEIVRIESPTRVDTGRTQHPMQDGKSGFDRSSLFGNCNPGKLGFALDVKNPAAREVIFDLVKWADVVTESFSPKAMRNWKLSYEDLCAVKPDIIMLSSSLMGQSGPLSMLAGFGTMGAAVAGFHGVTGFPDRAPDGLYAAYTDYVSPRFAASAVLAALEHHRQTGEGSYVDLSQIESSIHFLAPAILDWTVNGREAERIGNADRHFAPHGVYRATGDDRWVAVACRSDGEWKALCDVIGRSDLAADARFATVAGRMQHGEELETAIESWTSQHESGEVERALQAVGIAAHQVQDSALCFADAQLRHRGHFVELPHPVTGTSIVEGPRALLSRTPARVEWAAPTLGQHNQVVLSEILGYDDDKITELIIAGVLG